MPETREIAICPDIFPVILAGAGIQSSPESSGFPSESAFGEGEVE
jgi:hypothetical protein